MANELYLKYGTLSQYTAAAKDAGTLYFTEEGYLFKGDVEISTVKYMAANLLLLVTSLLILRLRIRT